jgi:hypothetical protein
VIFVTPNETRRRHARLVALALATAASAPVLVATAETTHVFARIALNHNEVAPRDRA